MKRSNKPPRLYKSAKLDIRPINITKSGITYRLNSYTIPVKFSGNFNLDVISLPTNNGKGDFTNATLTGSNEIGIDNLNDIRGSSLPILSFTKISTASAIYNLYKAYSNELDKLTLTGDLKTRVINGKTLSGNSNYTLFTDDDKAKSSTDTSIISLTADALVKMTSQLNIYKIRNMIISGAATNAATVNWELINIVFEGDMSAIKNKYINPESSRSLALYGIVYFKDKPYNNIRAIAGQEVRGMLKFDNLKGVSSENFKIVFDGDGYNVLDVRGVDTDFLNTYTPTNKEMVLD